MASTLAARLRPGGKRETPAGRPVGARRRRLTAPSRLFITFLGAALVAGGASVAADNWPEWRGSKRDGREEHACWPDAVGMALAHGRSAPFSMLISVKDMHGWFNSSNANKHFAGTIFIGSQTLT